RADHYRLGTDLAWAEAGAGAQRGADIEWHANEGGVELAFFFAALDVRQTHHGGDAAEAWHFVTAQRLVKFLVHGGLRLFRVMAGFLASQGLRQIGAGKYAVQNYVN